MKRFTAVVLSLCLLLGACAFAESKLVVTGNGTVTMQADQACASLGVRLDGKDIAELQKQVNETIAAIYAALEDAGLDAKNISTSNIYIYPNYDYSGEMEKLAGYSINHMLNIYTEETDKIGAYIDAAFAAGANSFESINFTVTDNTEARNKALELAVADAAQKAQTIAAASGKELGDIESIVEGSDDGYYSELMGNKDMVAAEEAAAGTTVRASQVSVSAQVQISYILN